CPPACLPQLHASPTRRSSDLVAPCQDRLSPIHTVAPTLPPRLHNEFTGKAVVSYIVGVNGRVQSTTITSAEWRPVGRSSGQPVRSEEHTSELQSRENLVCRLL